MSKRAFYPTDEVETELSAVPRGQISERLNTLIEKGLLFEKLEKIRVSYLNYDKALSGESPKRIKEKKLSSTMLMSSAAFQAEDEQEDFI